MQRPGHHFTGYADLHRHLDGSLRPGTLAEFARGAGVTVPPDLPFRAGMGLAEALSKFEFTLSFLQKPDAVRRVASEICEDAAADGVTTLEIRFAPQLHHGASMEAIVHAAVEGTAGRAGIILCALYGDDVNLVDELVRIAGHIKGVVGIDLAGGPSSSHQFHMQDYARAFRRAADLGLGCTVHAGEGRPAEEIRTAIELLGANRIGHGTTLLDDASVRDLVIERGVTIEACITSNVHVNAISAASEHPLARWLALGVRAAICTDNTLLSQVTSTSEHATAKTLPAMTAALLEQAISNGHASAFRRA